MKQKNIILVFFLVGIFLALSACTNHEDIYEQAHDLMSSGDYATAAKKFERIISYSDAELWITYCNAHVHLENEKFDEAILAFERLNGFSDSHSKIKECKYQKANYHKLLGRYKEAYDIYSTIMGYSDVYEIVKNDPNISKERLKTFTRMGEVIFGAYEQDNNLQNGKEPIEWYVLECDSDKVLLISKRGLDAYNYYGGHSPITWEDSSIREWLNNDFLNNAFSEAEQKSIVLTEVINHRNTYNGKNVPGGRTTKDRVFLLSIDEAEKYVDHIYFDRLLVTKYAIAQGAGDRTMTNSEDTLWWWLRSPGSYRDLAAFVHGYGGRINVYGNYTYLDGGIVRPVIYIKKNLE